MTTLLPRVQVAGKADRMGRAFSVNRERLFLLVRRESGSRQFRHRSSSPHTHRHCNGFRRLGGLDSSPLLSRDRDGRSCGRPVIPPMNYHQRRHITSLLPEAVQNFSIWGGSAFALKTLHADGLIPYWACFAIINVAVRLALFPLVLYGAQTSARFAKVVPEVQFLLTLFSNDMNKLRKDKAPLARRIGLMRTNLSTLGGIYKLHKINPFSVFLSPLLQLPIFLYVSVDLRKIVNGLDPLLAQQLVESSVAWVPDLTEPDPWFGLPILAGLMMYSNIEVAIGKRSLSGQAASKSDSAVLLKDVFQSFAVFMPCFTSQLPSGVQIYLVTSFIFTIGQSAALRTESFRRMVGLPSMLAPPPEAKYAKQMVELKQMEQKAREIRGDGPVLGKGVLAAGLEASFPGTYRKSTIQVEGTSPVTSISAPSAGDKASSKPAISPTPSISFDGPFIHGISAPPWQLAEQQANKAEAMPESVSMSGQASADREYMPQYSDEVMEKANRGEKPVEIVFVDDDTGPSSQAPSQVSLKRLKKKGKQRRGKKSKR